MNPAFLACLNAVRCTAPFTCADAKAFYDLIRGLLGEDARIDVFTRLGDKVFVRVESPRGIFERAIDVNSA